MPITAAAAPARDYAEEGGHWYRKDGSPCYEVPNAANGGMRPTTIRDARKLGLVPSVTTIMKGEDKPALTRWLVEQAMTACLTLPRLYNENDSEFMKRALRDSKEQVIKAAESGSRLHGLMESWLRDGYPPSVSELELAWVRPAVEWIYENFPGYSWEPEKSIAYQDEKGQWVAGKLDLHGHHPVHLPVIVDYKTKDRKKGEIKKLFYDNHYTQIAAYGRPLVGEHRGVNVVVSRNECGHFETCEWEWTDLLRGRRAFQALTDLWYARNEL